MSKLFKILLGIFLGLIGFLAALLVPTTIIAVIFGDAIGGDSSMLGSIILVIIVTAVFATISAIFFYLSHQILKPLWRKNSGT